MRQKENDYRTFFDGSMKNCGWIFEVVGAFLTGYTVADVAKHRLSPVVLEKALSQKPSMRFFILKKTMRTLFYSSRVLLGCGVLFVSIAAALRYPYVRKDKEKLTIGHFFPSKLWATLFPIVSPVPVTVHVLITLMDVCSDAAVIGTFACFSPFSIFFMLLFLRRVTNKILFVRARNMILNTRRQL